MERTEQQDIRFRDHLGTGALTSKELQERLSLSRTGHGKGNSQPTNSTGLILQFRLWQQFHTP